MARTLKEKGRAALLRRNFIWECLRCCDFWGHKAKVGVDGPHDFPDFRELSVKPDCPADTNETADQKRIGRANPLRKKSCEQASERCCTHDGHNVEAHDTAAFVIIDNGLQNGVA